MNNDLEIFLELMGSIINIPASTGSVTGAGGGSPARSYKSYDFYKDTQHNVFCSKCLENRLMDIKNINSSNVRNIFDKSDIRSMLEKAVPLFYTARCRQCSSLTILVIYKKEDEYVMVKLSQSYGGCISKNSPDGVKYYLDQAYRAREIGANSASMAMYRAALEQVLFNQGYTNGMLGQKLSKLEDDISNKIAPEWTKKFDVAFLQCIKKIGNGSIHTNDGDINKQKSIDNDLIGVVDIVFEELLDIIYEQPKKQEDRLRILRKNSDVFDKKSKNIE